MSAITRICDPITKAYNNLQDTVGDFLDRHPLINTAAIVACYVLRTLPMIAILYVSPYSLLTTCVLSVAGSLFYKMVIERRCPIKLTLESCLGAFAFELSRRIIPRIAMRTLTSYGLVLLGALPVIAWGIWVIHLSYQQAIKAQKSKSCCHGK